MDRVRGLAAIRCIRCARVCVAWITSPCGPAQRLGEACTTHLSPPPHPRRPLSQPQDGMRSRESLGTTCPTRGRLLPQSRPRERGAGQNAGRPRLCWPLRAGSAQVCATPIPAGPGAAGAAEVHGDRGLLELRHLGLRVHHRLPAFPAQLAAGAVVSEARARPPGGCPPSSSDVASPSRSHGAPRAGPETSVICHPEEVLSGPGVCTV